MSSKLMLLYAAYSSGLVGTLLVARTLMAADRRGRTVGLVLLGLTLVISLLCFAPGVSQSPPWSFSTMFIALACGFSLGFGAFRRPDTSDHVASASSAPATPTFGFPPAELRWVKGLMAVISFVSGLLFCFQIGQGSPLVLTGALALFFLGFAVQLSPGSLHLKGGVIGSLSLLAIGMGYVAPLGTF